MSQGIGLAPNLQRPTPPPPPGRVPRGQHMPPSEHQADHEEMDEYDMAEQGHAYPPEENPQRRPQKSGQRPRGQGPPRGDTQKPIGDASPTTWLERNRNLVVVSIAALIVLVFLLIWYQFSRQPAPIPVAPRGAGQARQQGAPPPERAEGEGETVGGDTEPSEAVDEDVEASVEAVPTTKPKPPAPAKAAAATAQKPSAGKKKATAKAPPKRERVQGDPIRTADDKEISEFANMDISGGSADATTEAAEEADAG